MLSVVLLCCCCSGIIVVYLSASHCDANGTVAEMGLVETGILYISVHLICPTRSH